MAFPNEPFRQLENVKNELDHFFTQGFNNFRSGLGNLNVDVYETEDEIVAMCDIPGLEKKEDVNIDIDNHNLTISGTINRAYEVNEEQMHRRERLIGKFKRTISLPKSVSEEGIRAAYKKGVLEIRMPKTQQERKRQIDVEFH